MMCSVRQFAQRCNQTVIVKSVSDYDLDNWPSTSLPGLIMWFEEQLESIPFAYQDDARVYIEPRETDGQYYAHICIMYQRPETNDEIDERVNQDRSRKMQVEQEEMALLERLEAKYRSKNNY